MVWKLQRAFYDVHSLKVRVGPIGVHCAESMGSRTIGQAWSNAVVPNFVTSNAFIARAYANVIAGLLRDLFDPCGSRRGDSAQPVYIVEVGAGHGRLAFLIVAALMDMRYVRVCVVGWPWLVGRG